MKIRLTNGNSPRTTSSSEVYLLGFLFPLYFINQGIRTDCKSINKLTKGAEKRTQVLCTILKCLAPVGNTIFGRGTMKCLHVTDKFNVDRLWSNHNPKPAPLTKS